MWTYIDAWSRAARTLGVELEGPVQITLSDGSVINAEMLVKGFGARQGTLVMQTTDQWLGRSLELRACGYTASTFGPYREGIEELVDGMKDILCDWRWCGDCPPPDWIKPTSWA